MCPLTHTSWRIFTGSKLLTCHTEKIRVQHVHYDYDLGWKREGRTKGDLVPKKMQRSTGTWKDADITSHWGNTTELLPHTHGGVKTRKTSVAGDVGQLKTHACWRKCKMGQLSREWWQLLKTPSSYHMSQRFHFWTYTQEKWQKGLQQMGVYQHSEQRYSQRPKGGNNPRVHQHTNERHKQKHHQCHKNESLIHKRTNTVFFYS